MYDADTHYKKRKVSTMDKETIILWEFIQTKLETLKEFGMVMSLNVDEKLGFMLDI